MTVATSTSVPVADLASLVRAAISAQRRFAGLFAVPSGDGTRLLCVLACNDELEVLEALLPPGTTSYPSIASSVPAASWYEREIADLFGIWPEGAAHTEALLLPLAEGEPAPRPGTCPDTRRIPPALETSGAGRYVSGEGLFGLSYGPVRSGVFEAVEYLLETPGEDLPHVETRVFYKHRGLEAAFEGVTPNDGVLLAERVEGVASVAHALAFCGAIEEIADVGPPEQAQYVRVLHAELERIANHLDSTIRHTEGAGQAVAFARLTLHKERLMRLRADLSGSRFSRGVVVPGGVSEPPRLSASRLFDALEILEQPIMDDLTLLLGTPSFLDRLRNTGVVPPALAAELGALGPLGRGSGSVEDLRRDRPYSGYARLGIEQARRRAEGDALARQLTRNDEIAGSFHLVREVVDLLDMGAPSHRDTWRTPLEAGSGEAFGWAEAPQGEVLYLVRLRDGRIERVKQRSASFHNLALFTHAFPKDIFTDFAFIEASFGLSIAGVAG